VARRFVAEGARVALLDVLDEPGAASPPSSAPPRATSIATSARRSRSRARVDGATRHFGGLDVLYNNAAVIAYGRRIADMPTAEWDRTLSVNLRGPFLCAKYSLPHLVDRGGGVIINVSRMAPSRPRRPASPTTPSPRAGLVTLTYYLASEYGHEQVRANCIAPGPVPTDLNAPFLGTEEGRAQTAMWIPLGRVGAIEDVAHAAVFLASDESAGSRARSCGWMGDGGAVTRA
jgi:NAD(P)-dependent dehydrogenase (short-subunit alcohol dehydrogenase family)